MLEPLTIEEILTATGGRFEQDPHVPRQVAGICTDSRHVRAGELFAPLVGKNFDGHDFVSTALKSGAAASLASRAAVERLRNESGVDMARVIVVDDTLSSYHQVAAHYRRKFAIPIVAITGSNGKTTTKDLMAALLGVHYRNVIKTPNNLNNEFGVPQTVFKINDTTGAAVIEMAMRGQGEIRPLARIAGPQVGIITNIGEAHLERLGSMRNIADAKGELIEEMAPDSVAVLPRDSEWFEHLSARARGRVISFGSHPASEVRVVETSTPGMDGMTVVLDVVGEGIKLPLPLLGMHNAHNLAAAVAAMRALGKPLSALPTYVRNFAPSGKRLEPVSTPHGFMLLNDVYNASPASMTSALRTLHLLPVNARRAAVLGDMYELGPDEIRMHRGVGHVAAEVLDLLVTVGKLGREIGVGADEAGLHADRQRHAADKADAARIVREWGTPGDVVLVKASRGMQLEEVIRLLTEAPARD